uniref:Nucleoporin Nup54 alpha-helical domain-containing protein n=1 Tax=Eucampia antarctica TaxID=49252 RepID=A0A7S2S9W4_9STRA
MDSWKTATERARASYEHTVHRWTHLQMLHHTVPTLQKRWQEEISTQMAQNRHLDTVILPLEKQHVQDVNAERYDAQVVSQDGVQFKRFLYLYQQLIPKCQSLQHATADLQAEIHDLQQTLQQKEQ